ncbi:MAG: alpha-glucan family phosphorylase [Deltaproteobacteria bacterium]|nr:alpha-glucan family phosphorylase [Deltaproteobacteria bacterium]MBI3065638.1 alpha-glucan family phosphorylase [Deltaproteobacteria bacterium]
MANQRTIAYFSMEIGLITDMPTYSGGLGVLAGDTIRAAADLKVPMVAVTLLHRKGYFYQRLDSTGWQIEEPVDWAVNDFLVELPQRTSVTIEGRTVFLRAWKYDIAGPGDFFVPVYFLDSDLPDNSEWDRTLTHYLYGGDLHYRLCQEVILGIGGVRILRALGHQAIERYHMNEGHSSLLALELLDEEAARAGRQTPVREDIEAVRQKCVFTTHTPVAAGHDQFPMSLVNQIVGRREVEEMRDVFCCGDLLNMTYLGLNLSHYVNGVAKKHGEIARHLFAGYNIDAITNGIHAATWAAEPFSQIYDHYIPGWRLDNFSLRYAMSVPKQEIWLAHAQTKKSLIQLVNQETNAGMDVDILTLGFARRSATYKRADLLFADMERLKAMAGKSGGLQIVFAGKAHPQDTAGKELIKRIFSAKGLLGDSVKIAYLENYNMEMGKMMTAGADVWLNTPQPPMEASGTSGMKAAVNGVPSLSVLDGWWIEGCIEGVTGWAIGPAGETAVAGDGHERDAESLYEKLEQVVMPLFYRDRSGFIDVMRLAIALNGSFFNTHRMLQQYVLKAYF